LNADLQNLEKVRTIVLVTCNTEVLVLSLEATCLPLVKKVR